jgi:thymidylate synthase
MRIYTTFDDALNELKRDIAELGMKVHPQTMQDKDIADDPDYDTQEYLNMVYMVTHPNLEDLRPHVKTWEWCEAEFAERIKGIYPQDGQAWKLRPEVWSEFNGHFGYSYGERYRGHTNYGNFDNLNAIINELRRHPDTRQAFLPVFEGRDPSRLGRIRVPCSLGYWFALRQGKLHITYLQRSGDYFTHLANDLWLTRKLQEHVAKEIGAQPGTYTHWIGSLHVYKKDVADVF